MKTPKDFMTRPWSSILQKNEAEIVARNIMVILSRTGNTFRELTWDEYSRERKADGDFSDKEGYYFDEVIEYCKSAEQAEKFSPNWRNL